MTRPFSTLRNAQWHSPRRSTVVRIKDAIGIPARTVIVTVAPLVAWAFGASYAALPTLQLVQTIPLPGVERRIDHLAVDVPGQRLFVAALGNNTLEVVDL